MTDTLRPKEILFMNQMLTSLSGEYILTLQFDGNLVLDGQVQHEDQSTTLDPLWATDTADRDAWYAMMRADGNFVLCDQDGETVWESETDKPGSFLKIQDDGRLVINEISPVWEAELDDEEEDTPYEEIEEMDMDAAADEAMASSAADHQI